MVNNNTVHVYTLYTVTPIPRFDLEVRFGLGVTTGRRPAEGDTSRQAEEGGGENPSGNLYYNYYNTVNMLFLL